MALVTGSCSACGRPLKMGVFVKGKMATVPVCKSPVCKRYGKGA